MQTGAHVAGDELIVEFPDNHRLIELCGAHDRNLGRIESDFAIQILRRGNRLLLIGERARREAGARALRSLYDLTELRRHLEPEDIDAAVRFDAPGAAPEGSPMPVPADSEGCQIRTRRRLIAPRTQGQERYVKALLDHELVFGIGPAGTGKTYLAVAQAVSMLVDGKVDRIVLSRPAVEAGERLGFLPGDMKEKVDPYMQPLFDALRDCLQDKQLERYLDRGTIEIAPLAFMRGRTLSSAFIVLDEAQNTTRMQMKMFLTRLGVNSRMAVNGDLTQIDLPAGAASGLEEARKLLDGVPGVAVRTLTSEDVVRSSMVSRIIDAYAAA